MIDMDKMYEDYPQLMVTQPHIDELRWLQTKVASITPHVIVETGVMAGASLKIWEQTVGPGDLVIGIDNRHDLYKNVFWDYRGSTRRIELINLDSASSDAVNTLKGILGGKEIDFLFIDGWHEDYVPQKDFENYVPFVRSGGLVGFDDIEIKDGEYWPPHKPKVGTCGTFFDSLRGKKDIGPIGNKGIWWKP